MVISQLRAPVTKMMQPVYRSLAKMGVHPNMLTIVGLGTGIVAGWAFATQEYLVAAILIFMSGVLDVLDGGVARVGNYASNEGAFLDSVADRLGESAIYIGLVAGFSTLNEQLIALGMLVFSYSISYLRARGEGLGVSLAGIGIMERAERMGSLFLAGILAHFFGAAVFVITLSVILVLVFVTAIHRFVKVYDALRLTSAA